MLKLHSSVALITNSSTSIYSIASERTIEKAKQLVNAILAATGSTQTADDLYNFSLEFDEMTIERAYYQLIKHPAQYGIQSEDDFDGDGEYSDYVKKIAIARLNAGWTPLEEYGRVNVKNLVVTDKDGNPVNDFMAFFDSIEKETICD